MAKKRPLNIYLSSDLIKRVKIAALRSDRSVSALVEELLENWLEEEDPETKRERRSGRLDQ